MLHVHETASPSLGLLACWAGIGPIVATFHMSTERSRALIGGQHPQHRAGEGQRPDRGERVGQGHVVEHLGGDAVLIPNGVDVRSFSGARSLAGAQGVEGARLGFLGRIDEPRKGIDVLLGALPAIIAEHPGVPLLVAGPGDIDEVSDSSRRTWCHM